MREEDRRHMYYKHSLTLDTYIHVLRSAQYKPGEYFIKADVLSVWGGHRLGRVKLRVGKADWFKWWELYEHQG